MDIAIEGTPRSRGRVRNGGIVIAVEVFLMALAATIVVLLSATKGWVGEPGTSGSGPPAAVQMTQPAPHPVPAPLGS
jgi:hypothetical protein